MCLIKTELLHARKCCSAGLTESRRTGETGTERAGSIGLTQLDEHLPLQVRHLLGGLLQRAAEPHLGPQHLQRVSDHVVDVDGERVVLGPNIQAPFPPDVPLHTQIKPSH